MWALGCLQFEMLSGSTPFEGDGASSPQDVFRAILDYADGASEILRIPLLPRLLSAKQWNTMDLVEKLLAPSPSARPTAAHAAEHAALTEYSLLRIESRAVEAPHRPAHGKGWIRREPEASANRQDTSSDDEDGDAIYPTAAPASTFDGFEWVPSSWEHHRLEATLEV